MNPIFTVEADPRRFLERVRPFLELDPIARTLPMTVLDAVVGGQYTEWVLSALEFPGGPVTACAVQTPPHNVIVAVSTGEDAQALAQGLSEHDIVLPGVVGIDPGVHEFAATWCEVPTLTAVEDRASRLFRLDALVAPRPTTGSARTATQEDLDLAVSWFEAFEREVGGIHAADLRRSLAVRITASRVLLWETADEVVSLVGHSPVLAGHARLGPVYTPPEHRGAGYASNLVAQVSAQLLELGAVPTLFTDLANPTSNAIYQAIGYTPVADAFEIRFLATGPEA